VDSTPPAEAQISADSKSDEGTEERPKRRWGFRRKERKRARAGNEDARLRALQMLVAGNDRETIAAKLKEEFGVEDPTAILDALVEVQPVSR
jgi:hypothetical protein